MIYAVVLKDTAPTTIEPVAAVELTTVEPEAWARAGFMLVLVESAEVARAICQTPEAWQLETRSGPWRYVIKEG